MYHLTFLSFRKKEFLVVLCCATSSEVPTRWDVTKTGNGEWGMGNGEWEIENGKWEIENGKLIFFTLTFYNVE